MDLMLESCVDDVLFLDISAEMHQEAILSDYSYLDPLMEADMGVESND